MIGLGTLFNIVAILVGGLVGVAATKQISPRTQIVIRQLLAALTFVVSINLLWKGFSGPFGLFLKQFGIVFFSLILGNAIGKLAGIQKSLNRLGRLANEKFTRAAGGGEGGKGESSKSAPAAAEGFVTCTLLFCVGPMAILGAIEDGMTGNFSVLLIKGALDGLSTVAFAAVFGWSVMLAAIPVGLYQGGITLLAAWLAPQWDPLMIGSLTATGGMLIMCIPLVILGLGKVPLSDYLPSLAIAPFLTWLWLV